MNRRIFFDASLIGVARILASHHDGIVFPGHPDWPYSQEAPDEVWLRYVGERDWCAILRDKRIRYRSPQQDALEEYQVRVVVIATSRNLTIEGNVTLLMDFWDQIEESLDDPPAYMHLTQAGLRTMLQYEPSSKGGGAVAEEQPT